MSFYIKRNTAVHLEQVQFIALFFLGVFFVTAERCCSVKHHMQRREEGVKNALRSRLITEAKTFSAFCLWFCSLRWRLDTKDFSWAKSKSNKWMSLILQITVVLFQQVTSQSVCCLYLEISLISCPDGPQGSSLVASRTFDSTSE